MSGPVRASPAAQEIVKIPVADWNGWMETARSTEDPLYYSWRRLTGSPIAHLDFSGRLLCGGVFSDMEISRSSFRDCSLRAVDFSRSRIENTDFAGALLFGTQFTDATLINCNFRAARMYCCDFTGTKRVNTRITPSVMCKKTLQSLAGGDLSLVRYRVLHGLSERIDRWVRIVRQIRQRIDARRNGSGS